MGTGVTMATKTKDKAKQKAKAHTIYKTADGKRVPGVTTITGVMAKPALIKWANDLGLQGIDSTTYVDELAEIGILAHRMVQDDLAGRETDFSSFSADQRDMAENALISFYKWQEENTFEYIGDEVQVVSELHHVGGTLDLYGILNGKHAVLDIKTSRQIYSEHMTQVVAYAEMARENGYRVEDVRILRIGRDEGEGFDDLTVPNQALHWKRFLACREIYELNKEIRRS
jgi:hypothetical protein